MTELLLVVLTGAAVACFGDAKLGMRLVVVAGFVQDPLRKLIPGNPVTILAIVLALYAAVVAGMASRGAFRRLELSATFRRVSPLVGALTLLVAFQSFRTYAATGSAMLPIIGFMSYVAPAIAGGVGFVLATNPGRFLAILRTYALLGIAAGATVLVARFVPDVELLRPIGPGLTVYGENLQVRLASGILRTPEVAAWHAATTGCVVLLLLSLGEAQRRSRLSLFAGGSALAVVVLATIWTGRRKALVELVLFILVYGVLLLRLRGANRRLLAALALGGSLFAYQIMRGAWSAESSKEASYLLGRSGTTTSDGAARLSGALAAIPIALGRGGLLGAGAGTSAQGSQHFGGGGGGAWEAEYGVGRVAAELGLAGLVLTGLLAVRLMGVARLGLPKLARRSAEATRIAYGLLAILAANAVVFVTAAQIFGDPFVYLMLGTMAGGLYGLIERGLVSGDGWGSPGGALTQAST